MSKAIRIALISVGAIFAITLAAAIGWAWSRGGYWYVGHRMMGGFSGGLFMWPGMLLAVLLIVWGIALLLQVNKSSDRNSSRHTESALDILKKRYASGDELAREEFEQKKKDLLG
jgi:uncharacterized membrane protein